MDRGRVVSSGAVKRNSLFFGFSPGPACGLLEGGPTAGGQPSAVGGSQSQSCLGGTVACPARTTHAPSRLRPGLSTSASRHGPSFSQDALGGLPGHSGVWPRRCGLAGSAPRHTAGLSSSHVSALGDGGLWTRRSSAHVPCCVSSARGRPGLPFFSLCSIWDCDLLPQKKGRPPPSCPPHARCL